MYKIEISLKAHQPLSLKRGVKSLQQLVTGKELRLRKIQKGSWLNVGDEKTGTLSQGRGRVTDKRLGISNKCEMDDVTGLGWRELAETFIATTEKKQVRSPFAKGSSHKSNPFSFVEKSVKNERFAALSAKPLHLLCNGYSLPGRKGESILFHSSHGLSLPRFQKKWTILRSPHIDKKSREQFEWTRCKDKIHIFSTQRAVTLYLLSLLRHSEIPGVELEFQLHFLTFFKRTEMR